MDFVTAFLALAVVPVVMFAVGYRLGYNNGLATWRKTWPSTSVSSHKCRGADDAGPFPASHAG